MNPPSPRAQPARSRRKLKLSCMSMLPVVAATAAGVHAAGPKHEPGGSKPFPSWYLLREGLQSESLPFVADGPRASRTHYVHFPPRLLTTHPPLHTATPLTHHNRPT